jgi:uncharacterized protein (TIGR02266 family)
MAQDTRKDPRAKVLSMTVRYKSATVDEFIEHHSHDVSRGGIFIKTPQPFPPGTLLKFEIRIQDEQAVLAGVGRVVWKRDANETTADGLPGGMGVKFIKIDDKSKGVIQKLVEAQGGGISAYEAGKSGEGLGAADAAEPVAEPALAKTEKKEEAKPAAVAKRAGTMLGLGNIGGSAATAPRPEAKADTKKAEGGFFPQTEPESEMPPPEERTVMKQAAELLKQALGEVGASIADDLNAPAPAAKAEPAKTDEKPKEGPKADEKPKVDAAKDELEADEKPAPKEKAKTDEKLTADKKAEPKPAVAKEAKEKKEEKPKPKPAPEEREVAAKPILQQPEESGGGGRVLTFLLIAAGVAVVLWLVFGRGEAAKAPPQPDVAPPVTAAAVPATATVTHAPTAVTPPPASVAPPAASAASSASSTASTATGATTAATATATAKATGAAPATAAPPPATAAPKPPAPPPAATPPKPKKPASDDPYG